MTDRQQAGSELGSGLLAASRPEATAGPPMENQPVRELVLQLHAGLAAHYDLDRWHWRDDTPAFDICLGSILVQHTAWSNVEKAIANLHEAGLTSLSAIRACPPEELAAIIRPAGTPLSKARRLQAFAEAIEELGGLAGLARAPAADLRAFLLGVYGIGPETADVICLYGGRHAVVVHDAYTQRFFRRVGAGPERDGYEVWRSWLDATLPLDGELRRKHHAGIVVHCKMTCRSRPKCGVCPVQNLCAFGGASVTGQARQAGNG